MRTHPFFVILSVSAPLLLLACGGGSDTGGNGGGSSTSTGNGAGGTGTSASASGSTNTSTSTSSGSSGACPIFPSDNPWNTDISKAPLDPLSDTYIANMAPATGLHPDFGTPTIGIPYAYVNSGVKKSSVTFVYANESDPGPYPIPMNPPIEDGSDAHLLMVHTDECVLYELFAVNQQNGQWHAGSGAIFDLKSNMLRPDGWTSADAAGLPIYPGLAKYEEAS